MQIEYPLGTQDGIAFPAPYHLVVDLSSLACNHFKANAGDIAYPEPLLRDTFRHCSEAQW